FGQSFGKLRHCSTPKRRSHNGCRALSKRTEVASSRTYRNRAADRADPSDRAVSKHAVDQLGNSISDSGAAFTSRQLSRSRFWCQIKISNVGILVEQPIDSSRCEP